MKMALLFQVIPELFYMDRNTMMPNTANKFFLLSIGFLLLFGMAMLLAASGSVAYNHYEDNLYYLKKQLLNGILPGIVLFIIASTLPYKKLKRFALPFFIVSLILLSLVFMPVIGLSLKGAARWIHLGFFTFQPSEILKICFILYLAVFFESKKDHVTNIAKGLVPFMGFCAIIGAFLASQPDLGTLGVLLCIGVGMFFAAGAKWSHLFFIMVLCLIALLLFVLFFGHALERIKTFLNPEDDSIASSYQISQALLSIKSGGVTGLGFAEAQGVNGSSLPEPMGDSIFAIIAQELGFIGVIIVICCYVFFAGCVLTAAKHAPDMFGSLFSIGVMIWVLSQAFINMSAISGIIPLTGIPLPFISYGGTSLVVLLTACGIVYNIQQSR